MGREIELKIPLSQNEYDFIKNVIYSETKIPDISFMSKPVFLVKEDEYYSRFNSYEERLENNEAQCIRIRSEAVYSNCLLSGIGECTEEKSYFTIKRKSYKDNMEVNQEDETFVENADVLRELFSEAKYKCWFKKEKRAHSVYGKADSYPDILIHCELVKVNNLLYIEVEVTDENILPERIQAALDTFVSLLKLDPQKKDVRSWKQIIRDNS
jgi:adenylate cyclase class IV